MNNTVRPTQIVLFVVSAFFDFLPKASMMGDTFFFFGVFFIFLFRLFVNFERGVRWTQKILNLPTASAKTHSR
jgi:hypothetical protein